MIRVIICYLICIYVLSVYVFLFCDIKSSPFCWGSRSNLPLPRQYHHPPTHDEWPSDVSAMKVGWMKFVCPWMTWELKTNGFMFEFAESYQNISKQNISNHIISKHIKSYQNISKHNKAIYIYIDF